MVFLLSWASPWSPRLTNSRQTFSRSSRRRESVRNGSTLERVLSTAHFPLCPRASAAAEAAERCESGSPARSSSFSRSRNRPSSSASTFCLKAV